MRSLALSWQERRNVLVADLAAGSVGISAAPNTSFLPISEGVFARSETFMDIDVFLSELQPLSAESCNVVAIEKAVANFTGDVHASHPLASHTVNASTSAVSDDGRQLVVD